MTLEEARKKLLFCDSYNRLPTLLSLSPIGSYSRPMEYPDWYKVLGEFWSVCDNIGLYRKELKLAMFLCCTPSIVPEMMDEAERAAHAALPEVVTVYRGCGPRNILGASWSLDRDIAAAFPMLNRYKAQEPLLVTATVRRDRICAVKLDREEQEVITFSARRSTVESLTGVETTA